MNIDRQDVLTKLLAMARGASELVMQIYAGDDVGAELKGPNDPVTRADKEANAFILAQLAQQLPGIPVVAEESDPALFRGFEASPVALFVDPVDGTRDFIAKTGEFCVMIGLAEEGRATVGVVLCPVYQGVRQTYGAAEGIGAFLFGDDGTRTAIHVASGTDLGRARAARCRASSAARASMPSSRPSACQRSFRSGARASRAWRSRAGTSSSTPILHAAR